MNQTSVESRAIRRHGVVVEGANHRYDAQHVLRDLDLCVEPGEFLTILGPSGCGKTTLLRSIGGLVAIDAGSIRVGGRDVTRVPAQRRDMGYVFQNYALFPHLTVSENVGYGLRFRKVPRAEAAERVRRALRLVEMEEFATRFPATLSGGQQQRVAIARAVVIDPCVLLLDEPLGALDRRLRQYLSLELRRIQRETHLTTIYVTHDQEEAFSVSDRIAVMFAGRILQVGPPAELYHRPIDIVVARFLGEINAFPGVVTSTANGCAEVEAQGVTIETNAVHALRSRDVVCGIRPEKIQVGRTMTARPIGTATVDDVIFQGSSNLTMLRWGSVSLTARIPSTDALAVGTTVEFGWLPADFMAFEQECEPDDLSELDGAVDAVAV